PGDFHERPAAGGGTGPHRQEGLGVQGGHARDPGLAALTGPPRHPAAPSRSPVVNLGVRNCAMAPRHPALLLALSLALAWAGRAAAADPDRVEQDERPLREARLPTDGPGLLDFFRKRTLGDKDRARIEQLIAQLGADEFSARERASAELVALGGAAAPLLRQ